MSTTTAYNDMKNCSSGALTAVIVSITQFKTGEDK